MWERLNNYELGGEITDREYLISKTKALLIKAVKEFLPRSGRVGVLFSGGVDSTIIAKILQDLGVVFTCYTSGLKDSSDVKWAKESARIHNFKIKTRIFDEELVKKRLLKICEVIKSNNPVKVGVVIPFYFAGELAKRDGVKILFTGLGSEELYAGYERFIGAQNVNEECLKGIKSIYDRDLTRDEAIMNYYNIKPGLPFLNHELIMLALKTPKDYKINEEYKKLMVRWVAERLNVDKSVAWRKKKAAQYGSGSDKVLERISKPFNKGDYLKRVYNPNRLRLGALYSGGKDSSLALYKMMLDGHDIICLITMLSDNPVSYMFHPSKKRLINLQSKAMKIPVIYGTTKGEKEKELKDLKKLILDAKKKYKLDGIITGALYSNYQRERIEKICEELKIKCCSPLWHKDQEEEIKELLRNNFKFIMTSVAAYGLNKKWLGKIITEKELEKLVEIKDSIGINIAGEGGEYESLVLDAPMFKKRLKLVKSRIIEENENTALLAIDEVSLESK
ncbi:MAG: diphthine--ammonia ligase [Nanoarchaeota archaeon]|nr:diphthine--ammonia ligase [Nanoarchaeota archaeon]